MYKIEVSARMKDHRKPMNMGPNHFVCVHGRCREPQDAGVPVVKGGVPLLFKCEKANFQGRKLDPHVVQWHSATPSDGAKQG